MFPHKLSLAILLFALLRSAVSEEVSLAPKLVDTIDRLNHPEGTNATIGCSVGSGNLEGLIYEWYKDDQRLAATSNKVKILTPPDNFQSILRIFDLKPKDAGLYSCVAKNSFGSDRIQIKLNVKVQLKWLSEPVDIKAHAGKPVHVPCSAQGIPAPRIVWRKLEPGDSRDLGPELTLSAATPEDSGYYECRASNGVEKDLSRRIRIDVLGK